MNVNENAQGFVFHKSEAAVFLGKPCTRHLEAASMKKKELAHYLSPVLLPDQRMMIDTLKQEMMNLTDHLKVTKVENLIIFCL